MCKKNQKTTDHMLFHCAVAGSMWVMFFCLFGVQQVLPRCAVNIFAYWKGQFGQHQNIKI